MMADIEEHIRKAMEDCKFKDLPGKGKRLNLEENPHADPEWRLAYHMLHSSGFSLPWIEARQEIDAQLDKTRADLRRAWEWYQQAPARRQPHTEAQAEWERAEAAFRDKIAQINRRITAYNLETPNSQLQILKINVEREIEAVIK